jgi:hypothetical protein
MYTRILVPLDGSARAEAVVNSAFECAFSEPSMVSSLVDGLEAEIQTSRTAITDGVQCEGIQTSSLPGKRSTAEATLAVPDAIIVNLFPMPTTIPAERAG